MKRGSPIAGLVLVLGCCGLAIAAPPPATSYVLPQVDESGALPCCPSPRFLGPRTKDGYGLDASFDIPSGITYDVDDGAFFISDAGSNTIRRYDPGGRVTTLAGACDRELLMATCVGRELDGIGSIARFDRPASIAYDAKRRGLVVYDADSSAVRFVTLDGRVRTVGSVSDVTGLAVNARDGSWYAAQRKAVIRIDDGHTPPIALWTAPPALQSSDAPAYDVNSVAVDSETGDIYATYFGRAIVRLERAHDFHATPIAGNPDSLFSFGVDGGTDGRGKDATFQSLEDVAFDPLRRRLIVADFRLVRSVSLDGVVRTIAGGCQKQSDPRYRGEFACDYPPKDGVGTRAHFGWPIGGVAVDTRNDAIAVLDRAFLRLVGRDDAVTTVAGNMRRLPREVTSRWDAHYLDTATGETMDVYVAGDDELEILRDPAGRIFDVRRGFRSEALANAQFWTARSYVRTGGASSETSFASAIESLRCGVLSDAGTKNPTPEYDLDTAERLFTAWYRAFGKGQVARYSTSPECVAVRVVDGSGRMLYQDYESRSIAHSAPNGLLESRDERLLYPAP